MDESILMKRVDIINGNMPGKNCKNDKTLIILLHL